MQLRNTSQCGILASASEQPRIPLLDSAFFVHAGSSVRFASFFFTVSLSSFVLAGCAPAGQQSPSGDMPVRPVAVGPVSNSSVSRLPAQTRLVEDVDLSALFDDIEGTFVLLDPQRHRMYRHNAGRASQRFLPASTFKLPHTIIAVETGVADGPLFALTRDPAVVPQPWWPDAWRAERVHLHDALKHSVVWFYQALARRIGHERMQGYLRFYRYGNHDISGGIDRFWLSGGLRISAEEQGDFLRRVFDGELGVSPRAMHILDQALAIDVTPTYSMHGKTGWVGFGEQGGEQVGWLVGYVRRGDDVYLYALNIDIRTPVDGARRIPIARSALRELGVIPRR